MTQDRPANEAGVVTKLSPRPVADTTRSRPDPIAISPAIGPLPPIYVPPPPGQPGPAGLLWHAAARAARQAGGWAVRQLAGRWRPSPRCATLAPITGRHDPRVVAPPQAGHLRKLP